MAFFGILQVRQQLREDRAALREFSRLEASDIAPAVLYEAGRNDIVQLNALLFKRHPVPERGGVVADEWIALRTPLTRTKYEPGQPLRRVEVVLPDGDRLVCLTNHLGLDPTTIARIYKDRWQIELFFKALKQNLRVKTFVGTSTNGLHVQIWTALIALLVLKYLQVKATFGWSLSNLVTLLGMNLFAYRDLWTWVNEPGFWRQLRDRMG